MALVANSLASIKDPRFNPFHGCELKPWSEQSLVVSHPVHLRSISFRRGKPGGFTSKSRLVVQAGYGDSGRPSNASLFIGGFLMGGILVGTLACVYAPQISKALAETDKKDLMRKLPKFIYDEEKALEKTRKVLTDKIAQLNAAIDDVSSQLRANDEPKNVAVPSDEVEAAM